MSFLITLNIDILDGEKVAQAINFLGNYLQAPALQVAEETKPEIAFHQSAVDATNLGIADMPANPLPESSVVVSKLEASLDGPSLALIHQGNVEAPAVKKTRTKKTKEPSLFDEVLELVVNKMRAGKLTPDFWKAVLAEQNITNVSQAENDVALLAHFKGVLERIA